MIKVLNRGHAIRVAFRVGAAHDGREERKEGETRGRTLIQCALSKDGTCCSVVAQGFGLTDRERSDTLNLEPSRCTAGSGRQRPRRWTTPEAKNNSVWRTANSWATRSEPVGLYQGALHREVSPWGALLATCKDCFASFREF